MSTAPMQLSAVAWQLLHKAYRQVWQGDTARQTACAVKTRRADLYIVQVKGREGVFASRVLILA